MLIEYSCTSVGSPVPAPALLHRWNYTLLYRRTYTLPAGKIYNDPVVKIFQIVSQLQLCTLDHFPQRSYQGVEDPRL